MNNQKSSSSSSNQSSSKLHSLITVSVASLIIITTVIGTYYSSSLYLEDHPNQPIHKLNQIPISSKSSSIKQGQSNIQLSSNQLYNLPYFANRHNFFNQKFVKLAWAWTTFGIIFHLISFSNHHYQEKLEEEKKKDDKDTIRDPSRLSSEKIERKESGKELFVRFDHQRVISKIFKSYLIGTTIWIFLTQWFFGSCLIERLLIFSGARCLPSVNPPIDILDPSKSDQFDHSYCQRIWGKRKDGLDKFTISAHRPHWSGGLDISGHSFLLSFSILLLISSTLLPSLETLKNLKRQHHKSLGNKNDENDKGFDSISYNNFLRLSRSYRISIVINLILIFMWWWMLLMTSLYFHGPVEKFVGVSIGVFSWILTQRFS